MDTTPILNTALVLVTVWGGVVVLFALWGARDRNLDPLPPEEPEAHDHH